MMPAAEFPAPRAHNMQRHQKGNKIRGGIASSLVQSAAFILHSAVGCSSAEEGEESVSASFVCHSSTNSIIHTLIE
jgi:hypothetical protein